MNVATRTLGVNAAFLREIKEDNQRLHEMLDEISELVTAASTHETTPRRLAETLSAARDQLALHFSLEEAYGYFEDAVDAAPQLSGRAEELRAQHGPLFLSLCQIVDEAEQWLYGESRRTLAGIAREFGIFRQDFRQHESREADLILEAFDSDVGVGD
jgi:hypothetical protein